MSTPCRGQGEYIYNKFGSTKGIEKNSKQVMELFKKQSNGPHIKTVNCITSKTEKSIPFTLCRLICSCNVYCEEIINSQFRGTTFTGISPAGKSVNFWMYSNFLGVSSTTCNSYFCRIELIAVLISNIANLYPRQMRGPYPKGNQYISCLDFTASSLKEEILLQITFFNKMIQFLK